MRGGEMLSPIAGKRWERDGKYSDKMLDKPGGGHYNISVAMRKYEPLAQPAEHLTFWVSYDKLMAPDQNKQGVPQKKMRRFGNAPPFL